MSDDLAGFGRPGWDEPIDVEGRLANAPEDGWVRGMFFQGLVDFAKTKPGAPLGRDRYLAFKAYPLREYIELLARLAAAAFPDSTLREGLRRLGHRAYPNLMASTFGKVLFSVAANDFGEAVKLVGQVYRVVASPGRVHVAQLEPGLARLELRHMWTFADAYQVGVFEGGMKAFRREGEVLVRVAGVSEVDLLLRWRP